MLFFFLWHVADHPPCALNVGSRERESEREIERERGARAVLQRTSFHFVRSFWRPRLCWASLRDGVVASGTPVVQ